MQPAVYLVRKMRIDAERSSRDGQSGIEMLRNWLRRIHMDLVGGWDQDTSQDDIAVLLGEYPRPHPRFGMIDPDARVSDGRDVATMLREARDAVDEIHGVPDNVGERCSVDGKEFALKKIDDLMKAFGVSTR